MHARPAFVGGYRLDAVVGHGPRGPVHRGIADRLGSSPVAVRRLAVAAGPARDELRHQAELLAALDHAGHALVEDLVVLDAEQLLVVTRLGPRGSLAERGPVTAAELLPVLRATASALGAAHDAGLVHGHLHLRNVVFADDGRPLVCDLVPGPDPPVAGRAVAGRAGDALAWARMGRATLAPSDDSTLACALRRTLRWAEATGAPMTRIVGALDDAAQHADDVRRSQVVTSHCEPPAPPTSRRQPTRRSVIPVAAVLTASITVGVIAGFGMAALPVPG